MPASSARPPIAPAKVAPTCASPRTSSTCRTPTRCPRSWTTSSPPTQSSYCATKFAERGFSEALWAELRAEGIGVTCAHPGGVRTNIVRSSRSSRSSRAADARAKQQTIERFERTATSPDEVARRVLRAVVENRLRVRVCRGTVVADWLKRLAPAAVHHLVAFAYRRFGSIG